MFSTRYTIILGYDTVQKMRNNSRAIQCIEMFESLLLTYYGRPAYSRCGHYIFVLFLSSSWFFPRLILAVGDWMSTIHRRTWCGLSAEFRGMKCAACCSLEMQDPKTRQKITICAPSHTSLSGYRPIFANKARIYNRKKKTC